MGEGSSFLMFENSQGWIFLSIIVAAAYAVLLYYRVKNPWNTTFQQILGAMRYVVVFCIILLIIGPYLKLINNDLENPIVVIALDNSSSVTAVLDSTEQENLKTSINELYSNLTDQDLIVETSAISADHELDQILDFNASQSDLNSLLKQIENNYEGMNLGAVVLVSDGIYNNGISPTFRTFSFPIYTIGVGDTTVKKDIIVKNLRYNKISYQGSKFPLIAEISAQGYGGQTVTVAAAKGDKVLETQTISFTGDTDSKSVEFSVDADAEGLQRIAVSVQRLSDEYSFSNNYANAYVDVIEGKENILILSPFPHPDVKALTSAIETNENYSVQTFIPGIGNWNEIDQEEIDLIILNQVPDVGRIAASYLARLDTANTSLLYVVGSRTSIRSFNSQNGMIQIVGGGGSPDNVSAVYNNSFSSFGISDELIERSRLWPPVTVPFGNYLSSGVNDILLSQRLSNIVIPKPLIVLGSKGGIKRGVISGEGIWKWRLDEYSRFEDNSAFNELILKLVQYLSTRQDKRKFRIYPEKNEYLENETVVMVTEVYDDIYNRVYGNEIELEINNDSVTVDRFNYVASENSRGYNIEGLDEGIYTFTARSSVGGQLATSSGQFAVQSLDVELLNLTADFDLLKQLSSNTGASFYQINEIDQLGLDLQDRKPPSIIHSSEKLLPLINLIWILVLLILLASSEWFIRKYEGGY